jgi:putative cytochrome c oxidase, cbb3-type, ccoQ subunit
MDLNGVRILFTLWVSISFALVVYVVMNKRNKANYDEAANSIVDDPDTPDEQTQTQKQDDVQSEHGHGAK